MRKLISTVLATMIAATSITAASSPAMARDRHHDRYERHYDRDRYEHRRHYDRDRYDRRRDAYRDRHHHRSNDGAVVAAGVIGLAVGAAIASNSNNSYSSRDQACANRYRSYDPGSNTYVGYDGRRYDCRL